MLLHSGQPAGIPAPLDGAVRCEEVGGVDVQLLKSCHSTWLFHADRMRFRRIPGGANPHVPGSTDWRPYYGLEVDVATGQFAVALNDDGTHVLRSRLHTDPCSHCGSRDNATGPVRAASGTR